MEYYHGSKDNSLTELRISHNKDGLVYVTSSKLIALTYAVRGYPNLFTTLKDGKEAFLEVVPGLFEKMVKNKKVYIYTLENKNYKEIKQNHSCGHTNCFSYHENIKVIRKECIDDAYVEFKKYIQNGEFVIIKGNDIPNREQLIKLIIEKDPKDNDNDNYVSFIKSK